MKNAINKFYRTIAVSFVSYLLREFQNSTNVHDLVKLNSNQAYIFFFDHMPAKYQSVPGILPKCRLTKLR